MQSAFTTPLIVEPLEDGRSWRLVEPFDYNLGDVSGEQIDVPAGFVTDFASVPQIFWNILPPWGSYGKAAVLHDWLYHIQMFTRARSDSIFLEAMKVLNVPFIRRWTIYLGVRAGGFVAWAQHAKENKAISAGGNLHDSN